VRLKELHLRNFRSWKKLDLVDLDSVGLCLILGDNGAGKSSIRQAIEYLLTDKTSDDLPTTELSYDCGKNCKIWCVITRDTDIIKITKYRNHTEFGNKSFISINGDDNLTKMDRRDTQKEIEKVLEVNSIMLSISTLFSQYSPSFPEAKDAERKELLYNALDHNKYIFYHENAKNVCSSILEELDRLDRSLTLEKSRLSDLRNEIPSLKVIESEYYVTKEDKIKKLKDTLSSLKEKDTKDTRESLEKLKKSIQPIPEDLSEEINTARNTNLKIAYEVDSIKRSIQNVGDGICPILQSECSILEDGRKKAIQELEPQLEDLESKYVRSKNILDSYLERKAKIDAIKEEEDLKVSKIGKLEHILDAIVSFNNTLTQQMEDILCRIRDIEDEKNPYSEMIKRAEQKEIGIIKTLGYLREKEETLKEKFKYYDFWRKGYSKQGIPNMKIDGFLESIEIEVNNILSAISKNMYVAIQSQSEISTGDIREKISYNVHKIGKQTKDYRSCSGGEKQRVKIADIFAFSKLLGKFNMVFLDEVLELSLDSKGKSDVIPLLRKKAEELGSLFVISHSDQVKDKFDTVMKIINKNGVSKVETK